jgi:1-acyl-sn-glycerol-3-phosphate acyltransferase
MGAMLICAGIAVWGLVRWRRSGQELFHFVGLSLVYFYLRMWHRMTSNRPPPRLVKGPALLVANHTCSADPVFLTIGCWRPISFLLARPYYKIPLFHRVFVYLHCIPVSRNGRDVQAVRLALQGLKENRVVGIFPEGGLSNAGRQCLRRGKQGAAYLALKSRVPVFPALVHGGPQTSDIRRAWLGRSRVRIVFGAAVDLARYYNRPIERPLLEEVTQLIADRIEALRPAKIDRLPIELKK